MQDKDVIIAQLLEEIAHLREEVRLLKEEITRLKKDSSNSSKPPSSDIVKPKKTPVKPGRKKCKRGGQHGHQKFSRQPFEPEQVDEAFNYELTDKDAVGLEPLDDWLGVEDIAKELKVSKSIIYQLIRNGQLDAVNIVNDNGKIAQKGHYRIKRQSLENYTQSKRVHPLPKPSKTYTHTRHLPKVKNHLGL